MHEYSQSAYSELIVHNFFQQKSTACFVPVILMQVAYYGVPSKVYEFIMDSRVGAGLFTTRKLLNTKNPAGEFSF